MRCSRCGNENSDQNRFCGMCGASLIAASTGAASSTQPQPVQVAAPATATMEVDTARPEPSKPARAESHPAISGPSFLGLSDAQTSHAVPRRRAGLSIDPHSAPRGNVDYLLDDEEPPRHWGAGKVFLILIALALAIGFGYLRWKTSGFAWLNPPAKKPDAAAQNTPAPETNSAPPIPSGSTPATQPAIQPAPATSPVQPPPEATTPASESPSKSTPAANAPAATPSPQNSTSPADASSQDSSSSAPVPTTPDAASDGDTTRDSNTTKASAPAAGPPKTTERPKHVPKASPAKPTPSKPVAASDPVAEAQKYLYGRGATQDCDRGMRLLKPAANQGNPKAMIEMGALYSAGLCTPHDLPTAYRWFALALRKDPDNNTAQADLQKLWKEMTPPERQLAIKLSQ